MAYGDNGLDRSSEQPDSLNRYLDAIVRGEPVPRSGLDPGLVDTVQRIHRMSARLGIPSEQNRTIWEDTMRAREATVRPSVVLPAAVSTAPARPTHVPAPMSDTRRRAWSAAGERAAVAALVLILVAAFAAYRAVPRDRGPETIPAAVATPAETIGTPAVLPGCTAEPRPAGRALELAGTRPTLTRILPRFNGDPFTEGAPAAPVVGDFLVSAFGATPAPAVAIADIAATLAELVACRFYRFDAEGQFDLDGRFFALYSDDFLRRELAGFREAGLEPALISSWGFNTVPSIDLAHVHSDGRVLVVLRTGTERHHPTWRWVAVFVRSGDRWLVDEMGQASFADTGSATPATSSETEPVVLDIALYDAEAAIAGPTAEPTGRPDFVPTHYSSDRYAVNLRAAPSTDAEIVAILPPATPLRRLGGEETDASGRTWLEFAIESGETGWLASGGFSTSPGEPPEMTVCDQLTATPVPCGHGYQRMGPYLKNEFPAGTDVTIRLHNAGSTPKRFVVAELDISVEISPGEVEELVLNAAAGSYLFLIFEEAGTTPTGAGGFDFIPEGQVPTVG